MSYSFESKKESLSKMLTQLSSLQTDTYTFREPQYDTQREFTDKMIYLSSFKMIGKCALITVASAGFGFMMGLIMSSFEFNRQMHIDTDRSTRSQLKQQFHGYGRFL